MKLRLLNHRECDLDRAILDLRRSLQGTAEIVSPRSLQKTMEIFGAPLTASEAVKKIVSDVRAEGDQAVICYASQLDGQKLEPTQFAVSAAELDEACAATPQALRDSLQRAANSIRRFQQAIMMDCPPTVVTPGVSLRMRFRPLKRVGICVPGWAAALPSSVLMCAIPAQVAGVKQIAMWTPPGRDGRIASSVLVAAKIAGLSEVYRIGGAHAVAAFALGTQTLRRVDKVVGPGNLFVTEAKRQLFGEVGIDIIAGPSEVLIIADDSVPAAWIAADMLSQAEHDPGCAVLLTPSTELATSVVKALEEALVDLSRAGAARSSLEHFGMIGITRDLEQAALLADAFAPEHLEIMAANAEVLGERISNAGAIFLGPNTPEAVGDYVAGPSHTLPTGGAARFMSGLSVRDFMKGCSVIRYSRDALKDVSEDVIRIAEAEGLSAHARSVRVRLESKP
jgi:histidinol dehydrogenase